jgi:hypothetical protein
VSEPPDPQHHHHHDHGRSGAWWRDWVSNWAGYDAPFGTKARLAARNLARRARFRPCCGHPGEPGC